MPISTRHSLYSSLLACSLLLAACDPSGPTVSDSAKPPSAHAPAATVAAPPPSTPAPASADSRVVDQLFKPDTIGMNLAYVNKLAGPAVRSDFHRHLYRLDGCELTLRTDNADKVVQAVEVAVTPNCQLSLEPLLGGYAGEPPLQLQALNFAQFGDMLSDASFYADCLSLCGNAADPVVTLHVEGPRALQLMEFAIEVPLVGEAALNASERWKTAMETAESDTYVVDTRFNCEPQRFEQVAQSAFATIQPSVFIFGKELGYTTDDCA